MGLRKLTKQSYIYFQGDHAILFWYQDYKDTNLTLDYKICFFSLSSVRSRVESINVALHYENIGLGMLPQSEYYDGPFEQSFIKYRQSEKLKISYN